MFGHHVPWAVGRSLPDRFAAQIPLAALTVSALAILVLPTQGAEGASLASSSGAATCDGKAATIVSSAHRIIGTKAPDVIVAGSGNDVIDGMGGRRLNLRWAWRGQH